MCQDVAQAGCVAHRNIGGTVTGNRSGNLCVTHPGSCLKRGGMCGGSGLSPISLRGIRQHAVDELPDHLQGKRFAQAGHGGVSEEL